MYEIQPLINNIYKNNRENWERTRLLAYIIAQINSSKRLNPSDIISFNWDVDDTISNTTISNEDIKRLKEKAKQYIN